MRFTRRYSDETVSGLAYLALAIEEFERVKVDDPAEALSVALTHFLKFFIPEWPDGAPCWLLEEMANIQWPSTEPDM